MQTIVKDFISKHNLETSVEHRALDLISEIGEVAKEILKMSDYGKKQSEYRPELGEELGDVYFSLLAIANTYDVDLDASLQKCLDKYAARLKKGGAGSEFEEVIND